MGDAGRPADDLLFADLVLRQGLCSREKVDECLSALARMSEAGVTRVPRLGELLVQKGYLTPPQLDQTLALSPRGADRAPAEPEFPADAAKAASDPANVHGKYVRVKLLGEGGMGQVFKAWDRGLGRWVALKFLRETDAAERTRLRREAQTAAKLTHPNIAAVYECQDTFIVLQFIDGQTLETFPRRDRRLLVELVRDAARAVQYAHERGVIHRDLKPPNIMIEHGTRRVYVMDFGLAKQLSARSSLSASGMMVGTPAYMPPEQAQGRPRAVGARSDVYGLGATLYEILAGRPPFINDNVYDLLLKVVTEEPRPVRKFDPRVPADLETIVMKCLEKEPERRYAGAAELADDLDRWLRGEAIRAHPPSTLYRLRKFVARRRGVAIGVALAAAALLAAVVVLGRLWLAEREGKEHAVRALGLWGQISNVFTEAELAAREGDVERARRIIDGGTASCRAYLARDELAHAHYFLGRLLHIQERRTEAESELTRALELHPGLGEAHYERGLVRMEMYYDTLFYRVVLVARAAHRPMPVLEQVERRFPDFGAMRQGAIEDLRVEVGESSYFRKADGAYGRAELARLMGDLARAEHELDTVLELDPSQVTVLVSRARLHLERGRLDDAIARATQAIDKHRGAPAAHLVRALAYMNKFWLQPYAPARAEWLAHQLSDAERAIALGATSVDVHGLAGLAQLELGNLDAERGDDPRPRYGRAIDAFDRAIAIAPWASTVLTYRGDAHRLCGDAQALRGEEPAGSYGRAIDDYDRALEIQLAPAAYAGRASAHIRLGDAALSGDPAEHFQKAVADLTEALRWDPAYGEALRSRGVAHMRLGDIEATQGRDAATHYRRAQEDLNRGVEIEDVRADGLLNRGVLRRQIGDDEARRGLDPRATYASAIDDFTAALAKHAQSADAYQNRASVRILLGDAEAGRGGDFAASYAAAVEDATRALERNPHHAYAYNNRANARLRRVQRRVCADGQAAQELAMALQDYERAVAENPTFAEAYAGRGSAHFMLNDRRAAQTDWEHAVELRPALEPALRAWIDQCRR